MPLVTFLPGFRKVTVNKGTSLLDAARQADIAVNAVCGGVGKCGKCIVFVKSGCVTFDLEKYRNFFSEEDIKAGGCLACETLVNDDLQVLVPDRTLIQSQQILSKVSGREIEFRPATWKYYVEVEHPTLDNPTTDLYRLLEAVHRAGGPSGEKVYAPLEVIRMIASKLRSSGYKVTATITLVPGGYRLIDLEKGDCAANLYGMAIDLGTTTVVGFLWDLTKGGLKASASTYNRQIAFGEDILSRVNYGRKHGLDELQQFAVSSINTVILEAANSAGVDLDDIYEVVVAGNTIMTHILMGIDPSYMIEEPYVPVVRRSLTTTAERIGVSIYGPGGIFIFPAVSDYIGGDVIADILASGMAEQPEITLLIDIGTNFEIVLGNNDWMFAVAGAAGPALEGAEVLFGMRANPGAIEQLELDEETLTPSYQTIGGRKPIGICGSGLIDLLAWLLKACVIDRTGRINLSIFSPRIRQGQFFPEFVVESSEKTGIGRDIVINENDIKNLIMSKAAILAACNVLLNQAGITHSEISNVYFAGGFGNYINKEHAITIGLIPEVKSGNIINLGNGAVEGANIALLNRKRRKMLDEIAYRIGYIELNADTSFMDEYTRSSFLPHTDLTQFPMVEKMLEQRRIRSRAADHG